MKVPAHMIMKYVIIGTKTLYLSQQCTARHVAKGALPVSGLHPAVEWDAAHPEDIADVIQNPSRLLCADEDDAVVSPV